MKNYMKLNDNPFQAIKSGRKTVEIRLYDEKRKRINIGDTIEFTNIETGESITVQVKQIAVYRDFRELYEHYDKTEIGYGRSDNADYTDMFEYYSQEETEKYGAVAITVSIM